MEGRECREIQDALSAPAKGVLCQAPRGGGGRVLRGCARWCLGPSKMQPGMPTFHVRIPTWDPDILIGTLWSKLPRDILLSRRDPNRRTRAKWGPLIRMASGMSGWRVGISTLRTERERDREQAGQVRCWGDPGGGGGVLRLMWCGKWIQANTSWLCLDANLRLDFAAWFMPAGRAASVSLEIEGVHATFVDPRRAFPESVPRE
eukprot:gene24322-biopygen1356